MNRFKGLCLANSVPEELWTELHNVVQEAVKQSHPIEKEKQEAKWLFEEALQIAE